MEHPVITGAIYTTPTVQISAGVLPSTGRLVAVKRQTHENVTLANAAITEILALNDLKHPNIVEFIGGYIETNQNRFQTVLIMELMEKSLAKEIITRKNRNSPWSEIELRAYLFSLVSALSYAQSKNIAHCDIKPDNIFLTGSLIKLGDFGCASRFVECSDEVTVVKGSLKYMAPEVMGLLRTQLKGDAEEGVVDWYLADVYSLGVTMMETATLGEPTASLLPYPRLLPILRKMTEKDPANRPSFQFISACLFPSTCTVCRTPFDDYPWIEPNELFFLGNDPFPEVCSRICLAKFRFSRINSSDFCVICGFFVDSENVLMLKCCHLVCSERCLYEYVFRYGYFSDTQTLIRCKSCGKSSDFVIFPSGRQLNITDIPKLCEKCLQAPGKITLSCGHSVCSGCVIHFLVRICPICRVNS